MTRTILSIIFLSSFTISIFAMHSITVDGKNIEGPLRPGQVLVYKNDKDNITLIIKNSTFELAEQRFSSEDIEGMKRDYEALKARKDTSPQINLGKGAELRTGNLVNTMYVVDGECINFSADSQLQIENSLFESKMINVSCRKFSALGMGTFVVANSFTIKSKVLNSLIKSIRFILSPEISNFAYIEGIVNFECDELRKTLIVFGSREVHIEFASKVSE